MNTQFPRLFAVALLAGSFTLGANAQASDCKTLEQNACSAAASCMWVGSYQRSDGRSVKAYCRSTPGKRSAVDLVGSKPAKSGG